MRMMRSASVVASVQICCFGFWIQCFSDPSLQPHPTQVLAPAADPQVTFPIIMGKAKPKPKPKSQAKTRLGLAAQQKHAPKKVNPFELKKTKSNFETMGRRTKGAQSNVVKARQEAITKVRTP